MPAAPKYEKVIVFGPTGKVGSIVAQTSHKYGSEVTLAMRDTSKAIPGLTEADEKEGKYTRVQADLSKPDSVTAAVKKSGAKAAFTYILPVQDPAKLAEGMASVWQALKDGGIEFVVFLSSFTVPDKEKQMLKVDPADFITFAHTQAELALDKVFSKEKKEAVCLRPGYFATNVLRQKLGIISGSLPTYRPDVLWDYITPPDIGNVGGNILTRGPRDQSVVTLFGPDLISQREAFLKVGKGLGKEIQVTELNTVEEGVEAAVANGIPEPVAKYMLGQVSEIKQGDSMISDKKHKEGSGNVEKYAARVGTRLDDWVKDNADLFDSKIEDVATAMPESAPEPDVVLPEDVVPEPEEGEEGEKEGEGEKKEGEDEKDDKKDSKKE